MEYNEIDKEMKEETRLNVFKKELSKWINKKIRI